jgi:hypothetical protein
MIYKGLNELKAKVAFTVACAAGSVELINQCSETNWTLVV